MDSHVTSTAEATRAPGVDQQAAPPGAAPTGEAHHPCPWSKGADTGVARSRTATPHGANAPRNRGASPDPRGRAAAEQHPQPVRELRLRRRNTGRERHPE